jgi:hypothetical protein
MTRVVSVGRSKSLLAAGAVGIAFAALGLAGCPGTLDPSILNGMAGSTGSNQGSAGQTSQGTAGQTSMAGSMGTAGTGGTMNCDMVNLITVKYTCTIMGACHDGSAATAAGFSMKQADWPKLVGSHPDATKPAGSPSICAKDAAYMSMPYIMKGSATGDGLLLKKLMGPVCSPMGARMPNLGTNISAADMPCFVQWATQLANM